LTNEIHDWLQTQTADIVELTLTFRPVEAGQWVSLREVRRFGRALKKYLGIQSHVEIDDARGISIYAGSVSYMETRLTVAIPRDTFARVGSVKELGDRLRVMLGPKVKLGRHIGISATTILRETRPQKGQWLVELLSALSLSRYDVGFYPSRESSVTGVSFDLDPDKPQPSMNDEKLYHAQQTRLLKRRLGIYDRSDDSLVRIWELRRDIMAK
jgi:hypothetical protein